MAKCGAGVVPVWWSKIDYLGSNDLFMGQKGRKMALKGYSFPVWCRCGAVVVVKKWII